MCPTEEASNKGTPSEESPVPRPTGSILTSKGYATIEARRFTKEDLHTLDQEMHSGPFDEVHWSITDEQGTHQGQDLASILAGVLWETVTKFDVMAEREVYDRDRPNVHLPVNRLSLSLLWKIGVSWQSLPEHR